MLCCVYVEMSVYELCECEEFISEGVVVLYDYLCVDDIWELMGLFRCECSVMVCELLVLSLICCLIFWCLVLMICEMGLFMLIVQVIFEKFDVFDYVVMLFN